MKSATWRVRGIRTEGAGLVLSALRLWGQDDPADVGAVVTCSHPPRQGSLANLLDGDANTLCAWSAKDVAEPGFYIEVTLPAAQVVWCARFASPSQDAAVVMYELGALVQSQWQWSLEGLVTWQGAGALSPARQSIAMLSMCPGLRVPDLVSAASVGFLGCGISAEDGALYAVEFGSATARVLRSKDGGYTWAALSGPLPGSSGYVSAAVSADGQRLMVVGAGSLASKISISHDGGATWFQPSTPTPPAGGWGNCSMSADGQTLLATGQGGNVNTPVWVSHDAGLTWTSAANSGLFSATMLGSAVSADGQTMLVTAYGSTAAKVSVSRNGGVTWTQMIGPVPASDGFCGCAMSADGMTMAVTSRGASGGRLSVSQDGGATWFAAAGVAIDSIGLAAVSISENGRVIATVGYGSTNGRISISRDRGATWLQTPPLVAGHNGYHGVAVSADGANVIAMGHGLIANAPARVVLFSFQDATYSTPVERMAAALGSSYESSLVTEMGCSMPALQALDMESGGNGRIYGTVELYVQAGNIPLPRRVRLHRSRDGMLVRETWSDAQGNYRFDGISQRYTYDVIAWDHEGLQRSVVANDLTPEVMP